MQAIPRRVINDDGSFIEQDSSLLGLSHWSGVELTCKDITYETHLSISSVSVKLRFSSSPVSSVVFTSLVKFYQLLARLVSSRLVQFRSLEMKEAPFHIHLVSS